MILAEIFGTRKASFVKIPVLDDGYEDLAVDLNGSHRAAGRLRGGKYSMFDGGTRVLFLPSWPITVESEETEALVSHADYCASFAAMLKQGLRSSEAVDSIDVLDALLGKCLLGQRELVVEGMRAKIVLRQDE